MASVVLSHSCFLSPVLVHIRFLSHGRHLVEPALEAKSYVALQSRHVVPSVGLKPYPWRSMYVPGLHNVHAAIPIWEPYEPAAHHVHVPDDVAPCAPLNVPFPHWVQELD